MSPALLSKCHPLPKKELALSGQPWGSARCSDSALSHIWGHFRRQRALLLVTMVVNIDLST